MKRLGYCLFFMTSLFLSCENEPRKLTPRMMKEVDREFRKIKKELQLEMDSLCLVYQEERMPSVVDSIVTYRLQQDQKKRIHIEE